jgi:hypothetical protein
MSRSTQFIGLTPKALEFVSGLEIIENSDNFTTGMFEEEIHLGEWKYKEGYLREVIQAEPWSSGPMIFTTLRFFLEKAEKVKVIGEYYGEIFPFVRLKEIEIVMSPSDLELGFDWKQDENVKGEVDYENGLYWV